MKMTNEYYINQPMQAVERKLNKNNDKNPHLINSISRFQNNLIIRKYSHIQFIN